MLAEKRRARVALPSDIGSSTRLSRFLARSSRLVDRALDRWLPDSHEPPRRLHTAMRYAVFPGGKRIRPALTLLAHLALSKSRRLGPALPAACAVELVHSFSLVHDDLPCLDDSPTRRGRPSIHRRFDEPTALLAGDALLALAFEILARPSPGLPPGASAAIALELGRATGSMGMIGGQAAELDMAQETAALAALEEVHRRKTGRLFEAAAVAGGLTGGADRRRLATLRRYARHLGLAFQIADDLLDLESDERSPSSPSTGAGRDTYPSVIGEDGARRALAAASRAAEREARRLSPAVSGLAIDLAQFVAGRRK